MAAMRVRINEAIDEEAVLLHGDDGTLQEFPLPEALQLARSRSMDLVEVWERPRRPRVAPVECRLLRLPRPVIWEAGPARGEARHGEPELDQDLWFHTGHCEGRHYLLGNPHTFRGRLSAWCPTKQRSFCVSKSEITECSREASYFLKGFLSGQEIDAPVDEEGDLLPPDDPEYQAWINAIQIFQETGMWNARFRICDLCGARLVPSNPKRTCWQAHEPR
jgi:hypothetical protein